MSITPYDDLDSHRMFMKLAVMKTLEGIEAGQSPFGACIVKNGDILAMAHNRVWETGDITAHAEINAIREACRTTGSIDLSGSTLYSTCEPCPMCFSAIHWARIETIVFGASIHDAEQAGFHELSISNEMMKKMSASDIYVIKDCMEEECRNLFKTWKASGRARTY